VGTNQDNQRKPARQGHLHPDKHKQRVRSGQTKRGREPGGLTNCQAKREGEVRTAKKACHVIEGALTSCRAQREQELRTAKESERAGGTHSLPSADGGISQDGKRKQASRGTYQLSTVNKGTSEKWRKKASERGILTNCSTSTKEQVSTPKGSQ